MYSLGHTLENGNNTVMLSSCAKAVGDARGYMGGPAIITPVVASEGACGSGQAAAALLSSLRVRELLAAAAECPPPHHSPHRHHWGCAWYDVGGWFHCSH